MVKPIPFDYETEAIGARPKNPAPVGLAIQMPGEKPIYLSWGHPTGNGVYTLDKKGKTVIAKGYNDPLRAAKLALRDAYKHPGGVLGQNVAKFDLPVAEDHWGLKPPAWNKVHDTMFSLFLRDPHATSLSLKPAAETWLGEPPSERDAVYDWLADHGIISKPKKIKGKLVYPKNAGAFICKAPGDLVAAYAIGDVTRAVGLHEMHYPWLVKMKMKEAYDRERELAPILLENERGGMRVDLPRLEKDAKIYEAALLKADLWIRKRLRAPGLNVDSDEEVAKALKKAGVVEDFPKTPTGLDSVSKKNLTEEFFSDRRVWLALYYRNALVTVLSMSIRPWIEEGSRNEGYIFTQWNQVRQSHGEGKIAGARSGRVTCSYFGNISKTFMDRGDGYEHPAFMQVPELPLVRIYLLPDEGENFGHSDYDQQELKLTAHYEDGALAQAYRDDPKTDIHNFVKEEIKRVSGKDYERRPVKIVNLRTLYGSGITGIAEFLRIPYKEAAELKAAWSAALPDVVQLDNSLREIFKKGSFIRTLGGRVYHCKPPIVAKKGPRKGQLINFFYTALNYLIQPSAADQAKKAMIDYHNHPRRKARVVVMVHDEINISMKYKEELKILRECMVNAYKLDVPVTTTLKMGKSWGTLEKVEV